MRVDCIFNDMTVAQADVPAAGLRDFGIMRYEYNGTSFRMKFLEQDKYIKRRTCVEVSGCFVGKDDRRVVYQCTGDGYALHLSSGHLVGLMLQPVAQTYRLQRFDGTSATFGSAH